jgi:acyl-CoA thioester hydrolase
MNAMIEVARSSVQTWEADAMGHLNVQFYVSRAVSGLAGVGAAIGLGPKGLREQGLELIAIDHHIRFLAEQRPGAPFYLVAGVIAVDKERIRVYEEMRNSATDQVCATFATDVELRDVASQQRQVFPADGIAKAKDLVIDIPKYGSPRGLEITAPAPPPTLARAEELGLIPTYQGTLTSLDCDDEGRILTHRYIGLVSDAIPNLLASTRGEDRSKDPNMGGAALEYRMHYHQRPAPGDIIVVRSGLRSIGEKTYIWGHWMFDLESGEAVATAEAVAISMNLMERKAVPVPPDQRILLEKLLVPEFTI